MLEECLETIREGLGLDVRIDNPSGWVNVISAEDFDLVDVRPVSLIEIADGCADVEVVTVGTASACGIAHQPVFDAVMVNNLLKFAPGHTFRADGKLVKPPDHRPPDIFSILQQQGFGNQ